MDVTEAVSSRRSVRAFLPRRVPSAIIREIFDVTQRAPSGSNLQPWHATVLANTALDDFRAEMVAVVAQGIGSEPAEYPMYPANLPDPYRKRRYETAEVMYDALKIAREDKRSRLAWVARNFDFFNAPVGMIVHMPALMVSTQWADLGIWMQTVMLLSRDHGLDSCAQEAWSLFPVSVRRTLSLPDDHMIFAGMAIGYADPNAPVNSIRSHRAAVSEHVDFRGVDSI
ncbi:nitroreductase [Sphingopyxis granuli]|uniref:nitroreductase n=1 Tax=Sphingopyxis granuli TaxID=267128 RepID=UPI001F53A9DB|nr:nitroreductase [Sphingopyxis granuli]UNK81051.1 nitroreductase [Sphingopyxis granuli]